MDSFTHQWDKRPPRSASKEQLFSKAILLGIAAICIGISVFYFVNQIKTVFAYEDAGIHRFFPQSLLDQKSSSNRHTTGYSSIQRSIAPKPNIKYVKYVNPVHDYIWTREVSSPTIGHYLIVFGEPVDRRVLTSSKYDKEQYKTIDPDMSAEAWIQTEARDSTVFLVISLLALLILTLLLLRTLSALRNAD